MKSKIFNEINSQISNILEVSPFKDVEKNIKQIVITIFSKLDLVTREEFDTQQQVLQQLTLKVEELEKKVLLLSTKDNE